MGAGCSHGGLGNQVARNDGGEIPEKKNQDNLGAWTSQRGAIEQGKKASSNWCLAHPWRLKQPMNREWLDGRIRSHRPAHEIACDMGSLPHDLQLISGMIVWVDSSCQRHDSCEVEIIVPYREQTGQCDR